MELLILSLPLFAAALYYLYRSWNPNTNNEKLKNLPLPPGPKSWPLIGDNLQYILASKNGTQENFIAERRDKYSSNCKLFLTSLLNENMVFFCSAEGNKFVFANENKLVKSWWPPSLQKIFGGPGSTSLSDEAKGFRKVVAPFLKPESLQKYIQIMDDETQKHLKTHWDGKQQVTVYPLLKKYTFGLGCRLFLNIQDPKEKEKIEENLHLVSAGFFPTFPFDLPGTKYNLAIKASKQIRIDIEKMVKQRRKDIVENNNKVNTEADVLSHLLMEMETNQHDRVLMNDYDVASKLYGLVNGAYENASAMLSSLMAYLADLPQVYEGVYREQMEIANSKAPGELLNWADIQKMKYSWNVACEVMRLSPPTPGAFREVLTDFVYEGYQIPKGFKVHWHAYATHKNPKYFPDPEKFEPSRFEGEGPAPFSYIPFGGGPRMCPGKEYARINILVFMHHIVKHFKWEKVFPHEKITADPISAPNKGLPIRLYSHN